MLSPGPDPTFIKSRTYFQNAKVWGLKKKFTYFLLSPLLLNGLGASSPVVSARKNGFDLLDGHIL